MLHIILQIISVLGALAILGAYVANQFRLIGPSNMSYSVMNFIGSAVLTVIAVIEVQWGFILLEGVWALVSLWGIITLLRGARLEVHTSIPSEIYENWGSSNPTPFINRITEKGDSRKPLFSKAKSYPIGPEQMAVARPKRSSGQDNM